MTHRTLAWHYPWASATSFIHRSLTGAGYVTSIYHSDKGIYPVRIIFIICTSKRGEASGGEIECGVSRRGVWRGGAGVHGSSVNVGGDQCSGRECSRWRSVWWA